MKQQWSLIFALSFALVIAVFSVVNVEPVPVDYVFGVAQFPLILVIIGSALAGGLIVGLFGTIRIVRLNRQIRLLQRERQTTIGDAASRPAGEPSGGGAATGASGATIGASGTSIGAGGANASGEANVSGTSGASGASGPSGAAGDDTK